MLMTTINFVESGYISHHNIVTKFTKKSDIINFLTAPKFYHKYLDMVKAEEREFSPELRDNDTHIEFPQSITYYSTPHIRFIPSIMTKLKINQVWNRDNDKFLGNIKTKYLEFNISIEPLSNEDSENICENYSLCFKGELIKKSFLISEKYLDEVLKDFGDIFIKISNMTN